MSLEDKTSAAFLNARNNLRGLLGLNEMSQNDLASAMGTSPSNLSSRLKRNRPSIYQEIAEAFAPAHWIAAKLFQDLADAHQEGYDIMMEENLAELDNATKTLEDLLEGGK